MVITSQIAGCTYNPHVRIKILEITAMFMVLIWFAIDSFKNHKPEKYLFYGPHYSLSGDYFKIALVSYKLQDLLFS